MKTDVATGLYVQLVTIEIGCSGHFTPATLTNPSHACKLPLRHCLIKLPELQYPAHTDRIFSACPSELWELSDLLN